MSELPWVKLVQSEILGLRQQGMSHADIAAEMGWPVDHVQRVAEGRTEETPAERTPPSPAPSGVYFIRSGEAVKIGVSINVPLRTTVLATGSPWPVDLLAVMPGDRAAEKRLHRRFAHLRLKGEWFRAEPELLDFIATL